VEVFLAVGICVAGAAAVMMFLIHALVKVRMAEVSEIKKPLSDEELDRVAERLALRLAKPDLDRKLLLDLAKMSEPEFAIYRQELAVQREALRAPEERPPERQRERA
jgi:hypothetical protein